MVDSVEVAKSEATAPAAHATLMGYCAGCGTWDAHAFTCSACGYDFTADAEVGVAEPLD